jgi:hypothetical protein
MKYKSYAGIGTRKEIPSDVELLIYNVAIKLAQRGFILRSGGADGCDTIFENGADKVTGKKEIYTPDDANFKSDLIAKTYHPHWKNIKNSFVKKLISRNSYQILGGDLKTPCDFVICYTHDGVVRGEDTTIHSGGTGQAVRIASAHNIPVYNLGYDKHFSKWQKWVFG